MPSVALFEQNSKVSWDDYFPLLRYQILSNPDLTTVYQVNQEMAVRIKEAIKTAQSLEELVEAVATKRYTKARVRRLLTISWCMLEKVTCQNPFMFLVLPKKAGNTLSLWKDRSI